MHKSDTGRNYLRYILPGKLGGFFYAGPRYGTVRNCNAECCVTLWCALCSCPLNYTLFLTALCSAALGIGVPFMGAVAWLAGLLRAFVGADYSRRHPVVSRWAARYNSKTRKDRRQSRRPPYQPQNAPQVVPGVPRIPQDPRLLMKNGPRIPNLRPRKPLKPTRQDSAHTQWLKLEYLHKSDRSHNYLRYILPGKLEGFFYTALHCTARCGRTLYETGLYSTMLYCTVLCCAEMGYLNTKTRADPRQSRPPANHPHNAKKGSPPPPPPLTICKDRVTPVKN